MISSVGSYSAAQTGGTSSLKAASATGQVSDTSKNQGASGTQGGGTLTISTLASQLADSASRAEARDKMLSRSELADKANSLLDQILGDAYQANKAKYNNEVPKTDDPELLARAKQATEFVTSSDRGSRSVKNPFGSLSREQLSNIIYDDSGNYTINERRAAYYESDDREQAWRVKVAAQAMDEYNRTGKMTNFFSSVLDHFKELPTIEQAQYPKDYASDLESKISRDFNYRTHQAEGKSENPMNLIEMLFAQSPLQTDELFQKKNITESPTVRSTAESNQSTSVSLSGRAIMLSRLFGTQNSNTEPPVVSGVNGMDLKHIGMSPQNFLTTSDRALLSDMYEYAQQQGADLQNVDQLAYALGTYRQSNDGRSMSSFNGGNSFDLEGHQLTVSFNEKDAATAARILNGDAINSTKLDQGFLRYTLDPGYGALSNTSDFEFMEQMVIKFSDVGAKQMSLPSKFSTFSYRVINESAVFTASKQILNPNPASTFKPQIINDNGKWIVLDPSVLEDNLFEQALTQQKMKLTTSQNEMIVNTLFANDHKVSKNSQLFDVLKLLSIPGTTKKP